MLGIQSDIYFIFSLRLSGSCALNILIQRGAPPRSLTMPVGTPSGPTPKRVFASLYECTRVKLKIRRLFREKASLF